MISIKDAVVWIERGTGAVMVKPQSWGVPDPCERWLDPIGATYGNWQKASDEQRVREMLETAIELAVVDGFAIRDVLVAFAEVTEFRALGRKSYPMCRALTKALVGQALEFTTMSFDALLVHYARN